MRPRDERAGSRLGHPEETLAFTAPAGFVRPRDSHARQTPWSVFQDGSGGSPTSSPPTRGAPEHAGTRPRGGRRARKNQSPPVETPQPGPTARSGTRKVPRPREPRPIRGGSVTATSGRSSHTAYLPRRAHGRPGAGRGARPTGSAPGGETRSGDGGPKIHTPPSSPRPGRIPSADVAGPPVYLWAVSRTLELSLQSSFQPSLTVLVRYRTRASI